MHSILVIEDDEAIRETIQEILELNGFKVNLAFNGESGIKQALEHNPDLVLCDVMMPKLNGWETVEAFRSIPALRCTPFVFLTAMSTMVDLRRGMNLGADDYLTKPFDANELITIISNRINKETLRKELSREDSQKQVKEATNELKSKIRQKTKGFFDSMNRAKTIQEAILPSDQKMKELFPNNFNNYMPKYSISGDFYWAKEYDSIKLIAVADCTGHGIPAALLSMTCYALLNEAVGRYQLRSPKEILTKVNELNAEYQRNNSGSFIGDGMDIALCAIDKEHNIVRYAGARRPIYVASSDFSLLSPTQENVRHYSNEKNDMLYELKGSIYSIGSTEPSFLIEEQVFEYRVGDRIYICRDGYADQFGEVSNKKYQSKNLTNLILNTQD
ncbi:MAG: response regulator, partial [Flavobacteriales bacterium]|nr:response regulator [Flavobacteriales bacterium]